MAFPAASSYRCGVPDETGREPNARPLRGSRILVAEDEFFIADEIARALAAAGAEVMGPVPDVGRGLVEAAGRPDAALLDVNLQGMMVWPLLDALLTRGVPVLLATGYDSGVIPAAYAGVPRYEKPVAPEDLVRALAGWLGRPEGLTG